MAKTFNSNPMADLLSNDYPKQEEEKDNNATNNTAIRKTKLLNFQPRETKNKRLQSLIKPSTHEKMLKVAKDNNISVNELLNFILEEFLKDF